MKKFALALCAAAVTLIAVPVQAQTHGAGEDAAAPSKPSTKAEKDAAKTERRATSKSIAKNDEGRLEDAPKPTATKKATADEKAAGKASRKAAGKETAKQGSAGGEAATMGK
jgi:hypothetical protein